MTKMHEYQPRTADRMIEILRSKGENPGSLEAEAAAEIEKLRKAHKETARRLQHLRNELSGRLSGDAATKFFGVTDTTISLIETALQ